MDALSRELGARGRADAAVPSVTIDEPEPFLDDAEAAEELRAELLGMRLMALQRRAAAEDVSDEAVEDAMDGEDPKAALVALVLDTASSRGPAERALAALQAGGETAADALSSVLDHAMDVLEQLSLSAPRKSRKAVLELMDAVEELAGSVDGALCDGVSRCGSDRLETLASQMSAVHGLPVEQAAAGRATGPVSSMLETLDECTSVSVQCEGVLSARTCGDEIVRLGALQCVRGLSTASLGSVSGSEASLFGVVREHLCSSESELSCEEQLSCWLALFVLGCRNGVSLVARVDVLEPLIAGLNASVRLLVAAGSDDMDSELRCCIAAHSCAWALVGNERDRRVRLRCAR